MIATVEDSSAGADGQALLTRAEAAAHLEEVRKAVRLEDGATFRDRVHALRSSAANVGALVLPELCRDWQFASDEMVRQNGAGKFFDFGKERRRPSQLMPSHGRRLDPRTNGTVFHS